MDEGRGEAIVERCLDRGPCPPPFLARGLRCDPGGGQALGSGREGRHAKPDQQLATALRATGEPWISSATRASLTGLAARFFDDLTEEWELGEPRQTRADHLQRVLRHLLLAGPDAHLH